MFSLVGSAYIGSTSGLSSPCGPRGPPPAPAMVEAPAASRGRGVAEALAVARGRAADGNLVLTTYNVEAGDDDCWMALLSPGSALN